MGRLTQVVVFEWAADLEANSPGGDDDDMSVPDEDTLLRR